MPIDSNFSLKDVPVPKPSQPIVEFKVLLVGDSRVGKTTFVKKLLTNEFENNYVPTKGVQVTPVTFWTNFGHIKFNIWDISGLEEENKEGYYIGADCAIIMFDVKSARTAKNVPKWYKDLRRICGNIAVVVVGNKVVEKNRKFKMRHVGYMRKNGLQYYDFSNKIDYQFDKPFLYLMKRLANSIDLDYEPPLYRGTKIDTSSICCWGLVLSVVFWVLVCGVVVLAGVILKRNT